MWKKTVSNLVFSATVWAVCAGSAFGQDHRNVELVGSLYDSSHGANDVVVVGKYVYVADDTSGLRVVDISDPAHPVVTGLYDTPGIATGVAKAGDYAYVADNVAGLRVVNVSDPTQPVETGFNDSTHCWEDDGVAVAGNYAYLGNFGVGLRVVNVSNPARPCEVGLCGLLVCAHSVAVAGDYAYVMGEYCTEEGSGSLRVVNISDPAHPVETGFYDTPGSAICIAVAGNCAYVADIDNGLRVVDVSDPARPVEIGLLNMPGATCDDVALAGNFAFVADGYNGLRVVDISDPTLPVETGFYDTPGFANCVAAADGYAYVGDTDGLEILDCSAALSVKGNQRSSPNTFYLSPAFPNPFNSRTTVRFVLPEVTDAFAALYDLSGRRVMTLLSGRLEAGMKALTVDGAGLAGGAYIVRVEAGNKALTQKLVMVK